MAFADDYNYGDYTPDPYRGDSTASSKEKKDTSWIKDVGDVLTKGLAAWFSTRPQSEQTTSPIFVSQPTNTPTKSGSGMLVVGLVAVVALGGVIYFVTKRSKP